MVLKHGPLGLIMRGSHLRAHTKGPCNYPKAPLRSSETYRFLTSGALWGFEALGRDGELLRRIGRSSTLLSGAQALNPKSLTLNPKNPQP